MHEDETGRRQDGHAPEALVTLDAWLPRFRDRRLCGCATRGRVGCHAARGSVRITTRALRGGARSPARALKEERRDGQDNDGADPRAGHDRARAVLVPRTKVADFAPVSSNSDAAAAGKTAARPEAGSLTAVDDRRPATGVRLPRPANRPRPASGCRPDAEPGDRCATGPPSCRTRPQCEPIRLTPLAARDRPLAARHRC
jgi:hypothetical protein